MNAQLLRTPPISGTVVERHFAVSAGANIWVRFTHPDAAEWIGVFGSAELAHFDAVVPFADDGGRTALVIAGGQGYIVDVVSGVLLRRTPWDYAYHAVAVPGSGRILVADCTAIWATDRTGDQRAWRREPAWYDYHQESPAHRVALDGVIFDEVTVDQLTGKVWEMDGWYAFALRLPDLEFTRGSCVAADWETFGSPSPAG